MSSFAQGDRESWKCDANYTMGPKISPESRRASDADNVYGPGFHAWRAGTEYFLSWDGGGYETREVKAQISVKEFERLRSEPQAILEIQTRHKMSATDLES